MITSRTVKQTQTKQYEIIIVEVVEGTADRLVRHPKTTTLNSTHETAATPESLTVG